MENPEAIGGEEESSNEKVDAKEESEASVTLTTSGKQENATSTEHEKVFDNDADFGDFAAADNVAEPVTGKETTAEPANNDFGDFTASTDDNAMNNLQENDVEATKSPFDALDDAFGDFSSPGEKEAAAAAAEESGAENVADETVTKVEPEAVEEENAVISGDEEERSSPVGDVSYFSTHAKESENGIEESDSGQDSNDAGYFSADDATGGDDNEAVVEGEEAVTVNQSESMEKEETVDAADAQETAPEASLIDEPLESMPPVPTEDATEASPEPAAGDVEVNKDSANMEGEKGDDFGDFGMFQQVETVATESADVTESVGDTLESNTESNADGVEAQQELTPSKEAEVVDNEAAKVSVGAEAGDDDDDDDFGDFGSFEQAGEPPAAVVDDSESPASDTMLPKQEQESADDDFGDFGSFEQADESPAQVNDVDEPRQVDEPQALAQVQQQDNDDDFGDFGDFTDFASEAPDNKDGEASTVESAPVDTAPPPSTPSAAPVADPIVEKAEAVFSELFGRTSIAVASEADASNGDAMKVNEVLAELGTSSVNEDLSEWYTTTLASVMRGVEHLDKRGPVAVVNECSKYPYAHFTVPVCGLPLTAVDIHGGSLSRPQSKRAAEVSAFSEIERVVGPSFSADSIDSAPEASPPIQQNAGTVVSLPPLQSEPDTATENGADPTDSDFTDFQSSSNVMETPGSSRASATESNGSKETLSLSAKQFLQQIPDLSFMLKPKLSLPKKATESNQTSDSC